MFDFIGFGALNVDLIYVVDDLSNIKVCGRDCEPGGEVFCNIGEFNDVQQLLKTHGKFVSRSPGGSAANTAVAMSRLGYKAGYIGQVGEDENGDFLLENMAGVDTSRIKRGGEAGVTIVLLDPNGERTIIVLPNANDDFSYADIDTNYAADTKFLHLTSFAGETPTEAQIKLAQALGNGVKISFDPGEIHTQKGLVKMMPVFKKSHTVFITDREVRLLTGEDYVDGTHEILNYGPEVVVCKLGKIGSYVLTRKEEFGVPAEEVKAIDKTGAGDVYAAGFIGGMIKKLPLMQCAQLGNKAAATSITGWGRENYPDQSLFSGVG
ncbi:MAG: carbohydrate kinase family protein [Actinomycetota bacterium]